MKTLIPAFAFASILAWGPPTQARDCDFHGGGFHGGAHYGHGGGHYGYYGGHGCGHYGGSNWFFGLGLGLPFFYWPAYYSEPHGYGAPHVHGARHSVAADVQMHLAERGIYHGEIDGDIGPMSREAIRRYQARNGLPATGIIDEGLLRSLGI